MLLVFTLWQNYILLSLVESIGHKLGDLCSYLHLSDQIGILSSAMRIFSKANLMAIETFCAVHFYLIKAQSQAGDALLM